MTDNRDGFGPEHMGDDESSADRLTGSHDIDNPDSPDGAESDGPINPWAPPTEASTASGGASSGSEPPRFPDAAQVPPADTPLTSSSAVDPWSSGAPASPAPSQSSPAEAPNPFPPAPEAGDRSAAAPPPLAADPAPPEPAAPPAAPPSWAASPSSQPPPPAPPAPSAQPEQPGAFVPPSQPAQPAQPPQPTQSWAQPSAPNHGASPAQPPHPQSPPQQQSPQHPQAPQYGQPQYGQPAQPPQYGQAPPAQPQWQQPGQNFQQPQQPQAPQYGQPQHPGAGPQYQYPPGYQQPQAYQPAPGQVPPPGWLGAPAGTPTPPQKKKGRGGLIAAIAAIAFLVLGGLGLFALLNNDDDPEVARGDGGRTSTDDGDTDDDDVTSDDDGGETDGGDTDTDDGGDDPLPPEPPQVALTIDNTIADLQEYWEDELPEVFGPEYIPLDEDSVFPLSSVNSLSCGGEDIPLDLLQGNAIYCPPDDYITWDDEFLFPDLEAQFGELAPALVMAHEWGHAIQARNGMDETRVPTVLIELQADCLAGGWVNDLLNRTEGLRIQPTDLDQAVAGLLNFSDPIEVSSQSPGAHGSGFDRVTAFGDGVEGGAAACADYLDGGVEPIDIDLGGLGDTGGNLPFLNLDDQGTNAPDLFLQDLQVFYDTEAAAVGETVPQFVDITRRRDTGDITCELPSGTLVAVCESPDGEQAGLLWDEQLIEFHNNIGDFGSALFISIEISRLVAPSLGLDATPAQLDCMSGAWTGFVGELPSERTTPEDRDDERLILSPGDLDEAIVGMLEAQAMDRTVFERVQSFRDGYFEGISACQGQ